MDNIKKENIDVNENEVNSLSEYNFSKRKKVQIIDARSDDDYYRDIDEQTALINREQNISRNNYPWEEPVTDPKYNSSNYGYSANYTTTSLTTNIRRQKVKNVVKSSNGRSKTGYDNDRVVFKSNGEPFDKNKSKVISGKYGEFRASILNKNAPLVFVVGGIEVDGKNPGQYMWEYGFGKLNNFNVYNCKTAYDSGNSWNECAQILVDNGIQINNKILVGYSAGAATMFSGVLKQRAAENWDIIHVCGPTIKVLSQSTKYTDLIKTMGGRVYYFQAWGVNKDSEGADRLYKQKIAAMLPKENVIDTNNHPDSATKSAVWIGANIAFNKEIVLKGKTRRIITSDSSPDIQDEKYGAKLKGQSGKQKVATPFTPVAGGSNTTTYAHPDGTKYKILPGYSPGEDAIEAVRSKGIKGYENGKIPDNLLLYIPGEGKEPKYRMYYTAVDSYMKMREAASKDGVKIRYTNCYRTFKEQKDLWFSSSRPLSERAGYISKPTFKKGMPETIENMIGANSNHGWGLAIDVKISEAKAWICANGDRFGWYWGDARRENWHFVYVL